MKDILTTLPPPFCNRALYNLDELLKITGLSRSGAFREFRAGTLKRILINGSLRVERAELNSWLNCKPFEVSGDHASADERLAEAVAAQNSN